MYVQVSKTKPDLGSSKDQAFYLSRYGMVQRLKLLRQTIAVLVMVLLLLAGLPGRAQAADDISEVRTLLETSYVDPVPADVLQAPTIDQMLSRLGDPYTVYFTPSEYQEFQDSLENQFSGLGIHITMVPQGVMAVSVIPGTPAEKAGLQQGDIITRADQFPLSGVSESQAELLLRGPAGTTVNLTVLRGSTLMFFKVTRQVLTQPEVSSELLEGHIGYLQINVFGTDTDQIFGKMAANLQKQGADAWIIDLRDNPGGYLNTAVRLAGYFIPNKVAVQVHDRSGNVTDLLAPAQSFQIQGPVAVLTNQNSASAAEILSAALKDQGAATLIGSKTFGKGSVQGLFNLPDGSVLKMTIDHFYSPLGEKINHVGVNPNIEIDPDYAKEAAALLLAGQQTKNEECIRIYYDGQIFTVPLKQALEKANWTAWQDIVNSMAGKAQFQDYDADGGRLVSEEKVAELFPLSYPGYLNMGTINNPPLNGQLTLEFAEPISDKATNADVQLIDAASGVQTPLVIQPAGIKGIRIIPRVSLQSGQTYWLVVNPSLLEHSGHSSGAGAVVVIHT
jgi:carboxyl-terminal processing protease